VNLKLSNFEHTLNVQIVKVKVKGRQLHVDKKMIYAVACYYNKNICIVRIWYLYLRFVRGVEPLAELKLCTLIKLRLLLIGEPRFSNSEPRDTDSKSSIIILKSKHNNSFFGSFVSNYKTKM
jgi:hypothetical protein